MEALSMRFSSSVLVLSLASSGLMGCSKMLDLPTPFDEAVAGGGAGDEGGASGGGASSKGGTSSKTSSSTRGGASSKGGSSNGGADTVGGSSSTGGSVASGGNASGGASAVGGSVSTGGLPASGGSNASGGSSANVTAPSITSFTASFKRVCSGYAVTLAAEFANGTGTVGGVGSITSGGTISSGAISAQKTFTLTVTNSQGVATQQSVTVGVMPSGFSAGPEMPSPRGFHEAVLLKDQRHILVTEGTDTDQCNNVALLYDSASEVFLSTGSKTSCRRDHFAALLSDGRIFIAGDGKPASLYDPQQGQFVELDSSSIIGEGIGGGPVGNTGKILLWGLNETYYVVYTPAVGGGGSFANGSFVENSRLQPTVTQLVNGMLLIAGGSSLASAEIYDPSIGAAGRSDGTSENMTAARRGHAAIVLASGKVLITGGVGLNSSEVFVYGGSGSAGTFSASDAMSTVRYSHTMTRLDNGNVLVAGGGLGAEVYDVNTGQFMDQIPMRVTRWGHSATNLANGSVVVIGGHTSMQTGAALKSTEFYCP